MLSTEAQELSKLLIVIAGIVVYFPAISNKANGFIPFAASSSDNIFNSIPVFSPQPTDVNPKNVTGLKVASNFLYLTDSSKRSSP